MSRLACAILEDAKVRQTACSGGVRPSLPRRRLKHRGFASVNCDHEAEAIVQAMNTLLEW